MQNLPFLGHRGGGEFTAPYSVQIDRFIDLLQGKGVMTTYWLRGEINPEFPDLVPTNDATYCSSDTVS